ncbi:MAG TPA: ankyrin repeat domain-containing protein [Candidatus Babeliales bacterium]|nr:ankyrin repeat domain-containing protein [Candidatus Babeliales bacterium]
MKQLSLRFTTIISLAVYFLLFTCRPSQSMDMNPHGINDLALADLMLLQGIVTGRIDLIQLSLQMGANINDRVGTYETPLLCTVVEHVKNEEIIKKLLQKKNVILHISNPKTGNTPLHLACSRNLPSIVDVILNKDPETICIPNKNGQLPLAIAAKYGHKECLKLLLAYNNAHINHQSYDGSTALHEICTYTEEIPTDTRSNIIKLLIEYGANTTIKNNLQATPLYSLFSYNSATLDYLLDNDKSIADQLIHAVDEHHNNQLHLCATLQLINNESFNKSTKYLKFLITRDVNLWSRNKDGKLPVDLAYDAFKTLYNKYTAKKLPYLENVLKHQEHIMHSFLSIASPFTKYVLLKAISHQQNLTKNILALIALNYYTLNIDAIIAEKYVNNYTTYYHMPIEKKMK